MLSLCLVCLLYDELVCKANIHLLLTLVNAINPFNADVLPQYLFPHLRLVTRDFEELVRSFSTLSIAPMSNLAVKYLGMSQALRAHGAFMNSEITQHDEAQYEVRNRFLLLSIV